MNIAKKLRLFGISNFPSSVQQKSKRYKSIPKMEKLVPTQVLSFLLKSAYHFPVLHVNSFLNFLYQANLKETASLLSKTFSVL